MRIKILKLNHLQLDIIKDALYWQMVKYATESGENSKSLAKSYAEVLLDIKKQLDKQSPVYLDTKKEAKITSNKSK